MADLAAKQKLAKKQGEEAKKKYIAGVIFLLVFRSFS